MTRSMDGALRDLAALTLAEAAAADILACPRETSLREVARLMAEQRVHCVAVCDADEPAALCGVFSEGGLASGSAGQVDRRPAGAKPATSVLTVAPHETLGRAAQLLTEHAVWPLLVVDSPGERTVGVFWTLDVAERWRAEEAEGE